LGRARIIVLIALLTLLAPVPHASAYSLITHEQLIDLTWEDSIVPLLLSRFPNLTQAQLNKARSYAYGGCVIQDIGYYPFGDRFFSNLTHYVRSGDFVINLFRNANTADELAFAVGALSHYVGDSIGHSEATNIAVPVEFPKLRAKYGSDVNYAEGKHAHIQTEFAFDINEISKHHMAPLHFLRTVGLNVSVRQVALAYYQTYGITATFSGRRRRLLNVPAYRFSTRYFIPRIAYALTLLHRGSEPPEPTNEEAQLLASKAAHMADEYDWQRYRRHAGIGTFCLAGFIFILPKLGPLKLLDIKGPTEDTDVEYIHSVIMSTAVLRRMLEQFTPPTGRRPVPANLTQDDGSHPPLPAKNPESHDPKNNPNALLRSEGPRHPLPNRDLDTGRVVQPGGYRLTDSTYADLLHRLTRKPKQPIPPGIKENILAYYADPNLPITTQKDPDKWKQVQADLATLSEMPTSAAPEPYPTFAIEQGTE